MPCSVVCACSNVRMIFVNKQNIGKLITYDYVTTVEPHGASCIGWVEGKLKSRTTNNKITRHNEWVTIATSDCSQCTKMVMAPKRQVICMAELSKTYLELLCGRHRESDERLLRRNPSNLHPPLRVGCITSSRSRIQFHSFCSSCLTVRDAGGGMKQTATRTRHYPSTVSGSR